MILVENDQSMLTWFKKNGEKCSNMLQLFIEPLIHVMDPLLEEIANGNITNIDFFENESDDDTFNFSQVTSLAKDYRDIENFVEYEDNAELNVLLDYDPNNHMNELLNWMKMRDTWIGAQGIQ